MPETSAVSVLAASFETKYRPAVTGEGQSTGAAYVCLRDDRPDWVQDAVREAHAGLLPDDVTYAMCQQVADELDERGAADEDTAWEIGEALTDHSYADLSSWLASAPSHRGDYVAQVESEGFFDADTSIWTRIAAGQAAEYRFIAETLIAAVRDNTESEAR